MQNKTETLHLNFGSTDILSDTKLFDKMKCKYSKEIYTIINVNKNTVNIENQEVELDGVKKTDIIIIKESYNNRSIEHIKKVEKKYKTERILKSDGIHKNNIINTKRN